MRRGVGNGDGGNMGDGFDTAMLDVVSNKRAGSELEEECSAKGLEKRVKYDDVSYGDSKIQSVVKDAWEGDVGRPISSNITVCANNLSKWASEVSGDVKKKISLKEKELQDQEWQSRDPDVDMIENSKGIVKKLDELQRLDDSYLHAPSRVNEVKDGDKNTSNFHHKASYRQRRNFIHELEDNSGQMHDNEEEIAEIISGYFSNNFESSSPSDFQEATAGLDCLVTDKMNQMLTTTLTAEEIHRALMQMHLNKAPGVDSMHALFYQKCWHIVGHDVVACVQNWWTNGGGILEG
ncbi:uncharacterized protein LOC110687661 [Chenopodium quinoa]|uniref:uncharacterized protein LOC110687661 n=1 Tax=Chenopodium quinoa TaxID=63459 RepID=UPI000B797544|nr:uncharacterized protein LOC110687661 [Chenopodium quinoa]